jgi:hypothetical protein
MQYTNTVGAHSIEFNFMAITEELCEKYEGCSESNAQNFFLGNYLFRMYEIHAYCNWVLPLYVLFFHIISIYVYGLTPARNKGMHTVPVPARSCSRSHVLSARITLSTS